jgi:trimeric autotransporter adhesin
VKRLGSVTAVLVTAGLAGGLVVEATTTALAAPAPGMITTVAGGVGRGWSINVAQQPTALAVGPSGKVYVGDDGVLREFGNKSLTENVVAGLGPDAASTGNGRLATRTAVAQVAGVAVDAAGNLIVATETPSPGGSRPLPGPLWVVAAKAGTFYGEAMTAGHMYQIADVQSAFGITMDHAGNVVYATGSDGRVMVLAGSTGTFYGQAMTAGDVYTIAGGGSPPGGLGNGIPATSAVLFSPSGVAVDGAGNVVIADAGGNVIRVVAAGTGTSYGQAMTAGDIYTIAGNGVPGNSGDGGPATSAELDEPAALAVDTRGNVLLADRGNNRIRVVAAASGTFYGQAMAAGDIYTIAGGGRNSSGSGVPATTAELNSPQGVAVDAAGNVLIADTSNHRVRVLAAASGTFYHHAMTAGDIYNVAGNGRTLFSGDGAPAANAELTATGGPALNGFGDLVISDRNHNRVRVVAGSSGTRYGMAMTAGDIYTIAGNGRDGYSGDGGPAIAAKFSDLGGVATDRAGNVVIADTGNGRIRVVAAVSGTFYGQAMTAGDVYTIAGQGIDGYSGDGGPAASAEFIQPDSVTVAANGNVLINDSGNHRVRVVAAASGTFYGQAMTAGDIYTIAGSGTAGYSGDGGPATSAELQSAAETVDAAGNVIIADASNERVRVVAAASGTFYGQAMTAGDIYTIAGSGTAGYSGDGGPAITADLNAPSAVAVDHDGNVIIADGNNDRVRVVAAASGTFYGQAMTAGDIYTIAGNGAEGYSGDGGPGRLAGLYALTGLAVNSKGSVLIGDYDRIRIVSG